MTAHPVFVITAVMLGARTTVALVLGASIVPRTLRWAMAGQTGNHRFVCCGLVKRRSGDQHQDQHRQYAPPHGARLASRRTTVKRSFRLDGISG